MRSLTNIIMKKYLKFFRIHRRDLLLSLFTILALLAFIPIFTYIYFARDLSNKDYITNRNNTGVILLDRNDKPFYNFYQAKSRKEISLDSIPKVVQQAAIASEDKDFYSHPGFSIKSILRSLYQDVSQKGTFYGGSTITQQLVKNALLNPKKNFLRKYQEIVLAQEIERRYSKEEILEMYLNSVYFGQGSFGIEQASQTYFNKEASQLDLSEGSLLIAILPSPSALDPLTDGLENAKIRQKIVIDKMVAQKFITDDQRKEALSKQLVFKTSDDQLNSQAVHFALMIKDDLIKQYGEETISRSGFTVKTTLDLEWQEYAEKVVADQVKKLEPNKVSNGSAVVIDPKTGEIRVLVGSKNWFDENDGKVNLATSLRQPGSSFKPIVYIAGFEKRIITPASVLKDNPITYKFDNQTYSPKDYDGKFRGDVLVRRALANSLNIPAVEIMSKVGVDNALEMAHRLGITTLQDPENYGLSLVLGAGEVKLLEMAEVYATFANSGVYNSPQLISEIKDKHDQTVFKHTPSPKRVLEETDTFLISSILSDNNTRAESFGNALNISRPAAVKTGTTENYRDAWTIGYTPSIAIAVWVGNNDGRPMDQIAGSLGAAPIWRSLMEQYLKGTPIEKFNKPNGIIEKSVCRGSGLLLREATSAGYLEYFHQGTEPNKYCVIAQPTSAPKPGQPAPSPNPQGGSDKKDPPPGQEKKKETQTIQINGTTTTVTF
jgi:1A family penicillin-binding protein